MVESAENSYDSRSKGIMSPGRQMLSAGKPSDIRETDNDEALNSSQYDGSVTGGAEGDAANGPDGYNATGGGVPRGAGGKGGVQK